MKKQWYEELFADFAKQYENEVFTKGTIGEVDFIEKEINYNKSLKILDVGCGTGRHSIELAKRGYSVYGFDLSEQQINYARKNAEKAGVDVTFEVGNATNFDFYEKYDVVLMLCEGSFSLMETDELNYQILINIYNSLAPTGKLIFTTLNGLYPLYHNVKDFYEGNKAGIDTGKLTFDLLTFRESSQMDFTTDSGEKKSIITNERFYVPSEITWLTKSIGFRKTEIFGAKLGAFSREDKLTPDDFEMLIIAIK